MKLTLSLASGTVAEEQDIPLLDDTIVKLPKDFRDDLANRLLGSLYAFSKAVMGNKDLTIKMHGPVCTFLDRNPAQVKAVGQPRETFKSTIGTVNESLRRICLNPNHTRVVISKKIENAKGFVGVMRRTAEHNRIFRTLWSHVIPKDLRKVSWNDEEIEFNRTEIRPEPTVRAAGLFSALASQHYDHIQYDDIIAEEEAESPVMMKKSTDRALLFRPLMRNPSVATMLIMFTHWGFHDTYHVLFERIGKGMAKLIRGAIEDGELTFPERLNHEMLAQLRQEFGDYMFSCLYMNNPRDESVQDFNIKNLKVCEVDYNNRCVYLYQNGLVYRKWYFAQLDITACVDFAAAEIKAKQRRLPDRNAVSVVGVSPDNEMISLEAWGKRCSPLELMAQIFLFHRIYQPRVWGLEDVQYQAAYKYFASDYAIREGLYLNIRPIKALGRKETRIRGLQPVAASGRLYVSPLQTVLMQEMTDFPLGAYDDCLDALSMHLQVMSNQMNGERWNRYMQSEKRVLAEIELNRRVMRGERVTDVDEDELAEELFGLDSWQEVQIAS
jgi:predicted phage terminase large subunit-like protein